MTRKADETQRESRTASLMERVMFARIEAWAIGLIVIASLIFTIAFGIMVRNRTEGKDRFGALGEFAFTVANLPETLRNIGKPERRLRALEGGIRFGDRGGWHAESPAAVGGLEGYVLLSRADAASDRQEVELVDLRTFDTVYTWRPDVGKIFAETPRCAICEEPVKVDRYRLIAPYAFANGDLLLKDHYAPFARISACGERRWVDGRSFHHSTEVDANGDIWSPVDFREQGQPPVKNRPKDYLDDAIAHMTADGRLIEKFDLADILIANGYRHLLIGTTDHYDKDPVHLNDVQPILSDGKHWKKGDLLLSMRNKSSIALFRPSTGKILWLKSGPWLAQHDVDVIGDGRISVFDNDINRGVSAPAPGDHNHVMVYDFDTDTVTEPYDAILAKLQLRTETEGLQQALPNGFLMAEETDFGRLVFIGPDGKLAADYINRGTDGASYILNWSRYVPQALGDQVVAATHDLRCGS